MIHLKTLGFQRGMWKLKNEYFPKKENSVPSAKVNEKGILISNPNELKNLYLDHFVERLRERQMIQELENMKESVEGEFNEVIEIFKENESPEWNESECEKVLRNLKLMQSHDIEKGMLMNYFTIKTLVVI